jgi:hypothetical protein
MSRAKDSPRTARADLSNLMVSNFATTRPQEINMKNYIVIGAGLAGILAAGSLTVAGSALGASAAGSSAEHVINQLRSFGYNVQLNMNGAQNVPLSTCTANGIHGLPNGAPLEGAPTTQFTTVYVDVTCPSGN